MSYGRLPYAGGSYGGAQGAPGAGGGVSIVDPANPTLPGYQWQTSPGRGGYGQTAYSGGGTPLLPATAGLLPVPDDGSANVRMTVWWADAGQVNISRQLPDGTVEPVPGAQPLVLPTPTRRNLATNPSMDVDLTGYLAGSNTTMARRTVDTLVGIGYLRATATAAGSVVVTVPVVLPVDTVGVSVNMRFPGAVPSGSITAAIAWTSNLGNSMGSISAANTVALATFNGRWDRTSVMTLPAPATATTGTADSPTVNIPTNGVLTLTVSGMAAGAAVDFDAVLVERGGGSGVYFDGDTATYGAWYGTPDLSASVLAGPVQFVDPFPPFDTPFRYMMTTGSQPTNQVLSDPLTVDSLDQTWLGHPTLGGFPIHVTVAPELTTTLKRGVYEVYGRAKPIVVSANVRQAPSGSLVLYAEDLGVRDRIVELLADGSPLRIRMPGDYGYGTGWWIAVGDATESANGPAWGPRYLTLPFQVVDAPSTVG